MASKTWISSPLTPSFGHHSPPLSSSTGMTVDNLRWNQVFTFTTVPRSLQELGIESWERKVYFGCRQRQARTQKSCIIQRVVAPNKYGLHWWEYINKFHDSIYRTGWLDILKGIFLHLSLIISCSNHELKTRWLPLLLNEVKERSVRTGTIRSRSAAVSVITVALSAMGAAKQAQSVPPLPLFTTLISLW